MEEAKKSLAIFVIAFCIASVSNMEIELDCGVRNLYTKTTPVDKYCCTINPTSITKFENKDVLNVTGNHKNGKTNSDVELVKFIDQEDISYLASLPKLQEVFTNLRYIKILNSNLNGISNQDLKYLPNLQYIEIYDCKISSLPSSLFQFNQKLDFISIWYNQELDHVGKDVFKNLPKLQSVIFRWNKCLNEQIYCEGRDQIDELSLRLSSSSCS